MFTEATHNGREPFKKGEGLRYQKSDSDEYFFLIERKHYPYPEKDEKQRVDKGADISASPGSKKLGVDISF
jgi:hypothetical protein